LLTSTEISDLVTPPNQVATPAISPDGGTYINDQSVTITCSTSGASIYYTTDGSTPDYGDTLYSDAFVINSSCTVKAIGIKNGMTDSEIASSVFTITSPLSRWTFDDGSGTIAENTISGYPDGTLVDNAAWTTTCKEGSYAIDLDGDDDWIDIDTINVGNSFTITAWVNTAASGYNSILCNGPGGGASKEGFRLLLSDQRIKLETGNGTSGEISDTASDAFPVSTWAFVAVIVDRTNGTAKIYLDANDVTSDNDVRTDFDTNRVMRIGATTSDGADMDGIIDDLRIYDALLSESQISELYNN
jgi:hypothetical protein